MYLAAAYALLQGGELLLPPLGAPDWVFRVLVIVAALGLPLAVILAWAFDATPEGIRRTSAEVDLGGPGAAGTGEEAPASPIHAESRWLSPRTIVAVVALVAVSATAGWLAGGSAAGAPESTARSIAVLPFDDFSSEADQEWFAAGMQEALITALQQIGALQVTSRTSAMLYEDSHLSMREIAGELGARWLVEGSVSRADDRIRISAQLIDGGADESLWAEQYEDEVEDILALQSSVARAIAREIDVALTPEEERRLGSAPRIDPDAYRAYVLGLDHLYRITPADFLRAVSLFDEAISLDPMFAPAHAALAVGYATAIEYDWITLEEAGEDAEGAAENAIRLDPEATESHHAQASVWFHVRHDFTAAEVSFRDALDRNPRAYALQDYGWLLSQSGRYDEAVSLLKRAVLLDPRSPLMRTDLGWWRFGSGDYEGAREEGVVALELDPSYGEAHWLLATVYAHTGRSDEALTAFDRYEEQYGEPIPYFRGYLLGVIGRPEEALALVPEVQARVDRGESSPTELATLYIGVRDNDLALGSLERAEKSGISFLPYLLPEWRMLFRDPRFIAVLDRFGLPAPR